MAIYYCKHCSCYVDDDHHPGEIDPLDDTELICPSCYEESTDPGEPGTWWAKVYGSTKETNHD